jgi:hypothetical protein
VKEKPNLWRLYNAATAYGCKPSDFFSLDTELAAWQLDEACLIIGRRVERNLNEGKDAFAGFGGGFVNAVKRGYRSAKQFVKKKMKIPESGVL